MYHGACFLNIPSLGPRIVVVGGWDCTSAICATEILDISSPTNQWITFVEYNIPHAICGSGICMSHIMTDVSFEGEEGRISESKEEFHHEMK